MKRSHRPVSPTRPALAVAGGLAVVAAGLLVWQVQAAATQESAAARNTLRHHELQILSDALAQYLSAHPDVAAALPATDTEICAGQGASCATAHLADLHYLIGATDLPSLPADPAGGLHAGGSGYTITRLPGGHWRVSAPWAEDGAQISVIR